MADRADRPPYSSGATGVSDFDYALYMLRLFVRLKRYVLHDELFYSYPPYYGSFRRPRSKSEDLSVGVNGGAIIEEITTETTTSISTEPRALKRRTKKVRTDRRSKSVEHRRKRQVGLHDKIPRSKDDLDFGVFTVIGRPPNPWDAENSLRRGKSLPFIGARPKDHINGFSVSTPNLQDLEELNSQVQLTDHESSQSSTKQTIIIESSNYDVSSVNKSSQSSNVNFISSKKNKSQPSSSSAINSNTSNNMKLTSKTLTELHIGELKRYFEECLITIKKSSTTQQILEQGNGDELNRMTSSVTSSDVQYVEELRESFEQLIQFISTVTEDFRITQQTTTQNSHLMKRQINQDQQRVSTSNAEQHQLPELQEGLQSPLNAADTFHPLSSIHQFNQAQTTLHSESPNPPSSPRGQLKFTREVYSEDQDDFIDYTLDMFEDFLQQLKPVTNGNDNDDTSIGILHEGANGEMTSTEIMDSAEEDENGFKTMIEVQGSSMSINDSSEPTSPTRCLSPSYSDAALSPPYPETGLTKDSRTFNFYYTIDAELSQEEYHKLVKIISVLKQQKKEWGSSMKTAQDKLDDINRENEQLSSNNNILRDSLEAANKAIKEINGKVHELKETLVPLRNENSALHTENEELKESLETLRLEATSMNKNAEGLQKMKTVYEEKVKIKEEETESFKTEMHEKFRNLEELYRHYQQDMEERNTKLILEGEELRKVYEAMKGEIEGLRKENVKSKKDSEELRENNEHLEAELRRKRNTNIELLHNSKENEKMSENAHEMESFYKREVEESNKLLSKTRSEVEKSKEETRFLEETNTKLKQEVKELESQMRVMESINKEVITGKSISGQQVDFLENEVEMLKKENKLLESIKEDKIDLEVNQKTYLSRIKELEKQSRELETLKRGHFSQQNENKRLQSDVAQLTNDLKDFEKLKRGNAAEKFENERLKTELQHLQKQVQLLEDQNKASQGPFSAELKSELERIRTQMRDIAASNQDRRLELYTTELKSELASLKDQIKELDSTRQSTSSATSIHHVSSVQSQNITNTTINQEEIHNLQQLRSPSTSSEITSISQAKDFQSQTDLFQDSTKSSGEESLKTTITSENDDVFKASVASTDVLRRSKSTGDMNRIYVSKSTEMDKQMSKEERLRLIEDRIRRKREKTSDWSIRTPSIDKLRRKSLEELTAVMDDGDQTDSTGYVYTGRRRERSPSIGRRSKSAGPRGGYQDGVVSPPRRGRSPNRRDRGRDQPIQRSEPDRSGYQYGVEIMVDSKTPTLYTGQPQSYPELQSSDQDQHPSLPPYQPGAASRHRSEERKRVKKRLSSSMMMYPPDDGSSSSEWEYQRLTKSLDHQRNHQQPRQYIEDTHSVDQMLSQAMNSRQTEAYHKNRKGQQSSHSNSSNHQRTRSTNQILEQYVAEKIQRRKMQEESPLHQPRLPQSHLIGSHLSQPNLIGAQYQEQNLIGYQQGYGTERRYTSPGKNTRGQIDSRQQYEEEMRKQNILLTRSKTLDKDFRTKGSGRSTRQTATTYQHSGTTHHNGYSHQTLSKSKEEMLRSIKANQQQGVKITLTPKEVSKGGFDQRPGRQSEKRANDDPLEHEKMEKARQKMLSKMQQEKGQTEKKQITRSGIPMQRRSKHHESAENSFISQEQAELYYSLKTRDSNKTQSSQQRQKTQQQYEQSITRTYSAPNRKHGDKNLLRGQNGETFKTLDGKDTKREKEKSSKSHSKDQGQLSYDQEWVLGQRDSNNNQRSTRPKSAGHSRTEKTAQHQHSRPENVGSSRPKSAGHKRPENSLSQRHSDQYHCDICRRLNKNRSEGEPARYCWERYYAVSSSTPRVSLT
eukprot:TCONS_00005427-protein